MAKTKNNIEEAFIVLHSNGYIESVNKTACNIFGYNSNELVNKHVNKIFNDNTFSLNSLFTDLEKDQPVVSFEHECYLKNGKCVALSFSCFVLYNDSNKIHSIACIVKDRSQHKQIEKERKFAAETNIKKAHELEIALNQLKLAQDISLKSMTDLELKRARLEFEIVERKKLEGIYASERERLSVTMHSIGEGVIATDDKSYITMFNKTAHTLTGWERNYALGKPLNKVLLLINKKNGTILEDPLEKVFKNRKIITFEDETVLISKDKTEKNISSSAAPILDKKNNIIGAVLVFRDITKVKQFEMEKENLRVQMVNRSKLASLGEISTGIAHEINQPLTYISCFIQNLKRDLEDDCIDTEELKTSLKTSYNQIMKIDSIIKHLRTFGRSDDMVKQKFHIKDVLDNTLLLIGERIRLCNIKLKKNIEENLPHILGCPIQLEQVFINLLQNALDAFSLNNNKKLKHISIFINKKNQDSITIKVEDNGDGIEKMHLAKIFEPFFTTKEVGMGTGLGLSIIYGIISEHNGTIACESEVGNGTSFIITLPTN